MPTQYALSTSNIVTAQHPLGLRAIRLFEELYDNAELTPRRAQHLNENHIFAGQLGDAIRHFSSENPGSFETPLDGPYWSEPGKRMLPFRVTPRDPKGQKASNVFRDKYNKARLTREQALCINESKEFWCTVDRLIMRGSAHSFLISNVTQVRSKLGYGTYERPNSLTHQAEMIRMHLGIQLRTDIPLRNLLIPDPAEGNFLVPSWRLVAPTYAESVKVVVEALGKQYGHPLVAKEDDFPFEFSDEHLRMSLESSAMWEEFFAQYGDSMVIPAQFGIRYRGYSAQEANNGMAQDEFGLGAFAVGVMLLTHPERIMGKSGLTALVCAGDEYDGNSAGGPFSRVPAFSVMGGDLKFHTYWEGLASDYFSVPSGWLG